MRVGFGLLVGGTGVFVCVTSGVSVGSTRVGVLVGVSVGVCVKVAVLSGVCVKVSVGVAVGVLVGSHSTPSDCAETVNTSTIRLSKTSFFIQFLLSLKVELLVSVFRLLVSLLLLHIYGNSDSWSFRRE